MAYWIWYPGDFEIYHGMRQNFSREELGYEWPAYWRVDDCRHNVKFSTIHTFETAADFCVKAQGIGHVCVKWKPDCFEGQDIPPYMYEAKKFRLGAKIHCPAKEVSIEVIVGNMEGLPCIYVDGALESGPDWLVTDHASALMPVGYNRMYTRLEQNPMEFEFASQILAPVRTEQVDDGILYDFGREITAHALVELAAGAAPGEAGLTVTLCYGESRAEALDVDYSYFKDTLELTVGSECRTKLRAFRYIYIPQGAAAAKLDMKADFEYVDFAHRSHFTCSDSRVNDIWKVAEDTFRLASGIFFIDGVKRDRWIWSGDAYQSYLISRYLFFDADVCKRTILALRGNDPVTQHINTIVDYSMYWLMSIGDYYMMTRDDEFIRMIYPKMTSMMAYIMEQIDDNGFIYGRPGDWIFVDWSEIDKEGPVCAEQMLLAKCYEAMIQAGARMGVDTGDFTARHKALLENIRKFYWNSAKGAFIDSFESGKNHVSRHANIFAIIFDFATEAETASILENVLFNDAVTAITTPYFKFYELEALSKLGYYDQVLTQMKAYWGGMLDKGATTFWEEYNPEDTEDVQYDMYGDKYFKSLCHAWGASPIYLIGRYFMGLKPTAPGYETFEIAPQADIFENYDCAFAIGEDALVKVHFENGELSVTADRDGGTLVWKDEKYCLKAGETLMVRPQEDK